MKILENDSVLDVQKKFNHVYPFLKIEFYDKPHAAHSGSGILEQLPEDALISEVYPNFFETVIDVYNEDMSVSELEQLFENQAGLHVQVFRKSGSVWLQTTSTDDWSIRKHLEKAEQFEHPDFGQIEM